MLRGIAIMAGVGVATSALAGELRPEEAKRFIAGKHFSYTCFDGSKGAGLISADGAVTGTIQIRGAGPVRFVTLPPGTIRVQSNSICASLHGMPFQPCFAVNQIELAKFPRLAHGPEFRLLRLHAPQSPAGTVQFRAAPRRCGPAGIGKRLRPSGVGGHPPFATLRNE